MLSDDQKKRFAEIWQKRFGQEISAEEVDRESSRLVRLVQLICKPTTEGKSKDIKKLDGNLNEKNKS